MGVAIITGAGTGIGAATARCLAAGGWDLALVGRRAGLLEQVAAGIASRGRAPLVLPIDLAEPESARLVVARTAEALGGVDVLVNNAAVIRVMPLAEYTTEILDQHWAVNIRAPFLLIQAALPWLQKRGGAVVNVSSSSGTILRPGQSLYGMTKHALEYLTRSFAGELAPQRIRVNALALGPVDTPIHETWAKDLQAAYEWLAGQVPLGRIASADEIARWIEFLVSPAAGWLTGAVIPLDGGQALDIA
jgi:NAD(P)-dependent dehydrogenase (short-subunit alcohol dehydrogenase family)